MRLYWVIYQEYGAERTYNSVPCDYETALRLLRSFRLTYVGKVYPNKRGFYPFNNSHIIEDESNA